MAPAAWAKLTLMLKKQVPRWISAHAPVSAPAGIALQASPLSPTVVTSLTDAVSGELIFGPSPTNPRSSPRPPAPLTRTVWYTWCLLAEAPTAIALGAVPGELTV